MMRLRLNNIYLFLANLLYVFSLNFAYSTYWLLQDYFPVSNFYGVTAEKFIIVFLFLCCSFVIFPKNLQKPSSIFVWILYYLLYLPVLVYFLGHNSDLQYLDLGIAILLLLSFIVVSIPAFTLNKHIGSDLQSGLFKPESLSGPFLILWIMMCVLIFNNFATIMSIKTFDEIYIQREIGRADSLFYAYLQLYFVYVASAYIFLLGLYVRNIIFLLVGIFGCIVSYAINAERTVLMLPFLWSFVYFVTSKNSQIKYLIFIVLFASCLFSILGIFSGDFELIKELGFYLFARPVAVPGSFFKDYYSYFTEFGYTNFSHVSGLNLFFDPDSVLASDPLYPELGKIIARDVHGIESNSNASFLSWDGLAGFGVIGVLIISIVLSGVMFILNFFSRYWPARFVVALIAPFPYLLTNGSLFTVLLSFGFFFLIFIFFLTWFFLNNLRKIKA